MMATDPRLGLLLGVSPPEELMTLCFELAHWVPLGDGRDGDYDVFVWRPSDPSHPGSRPYVLWADDRHAVEVHGERALLIVTSDIDVADFAVNCGRLVRRVPQLLDTGRAARPVTPFVRSRLRSARRLPERALAEHRHGWNWAGHPVDSELADTVVALASAVTVTDVNELVRALAWQTPIVTSPVSAGLVGIVDDVHGVVASTPLERATAAAVLADDQRTATRLSWQARLLYEGRHSWQVCTEDVLAAIGVLGTWSPSTLMLRLGELGASPTAPLVRRVSAAVAPIVHPALVLVGDPS